MAYACSDARTHTHTHTKCKHQCTRTLYNLPYINNTHTHSHSHTHAHTHTHTHTHRCTHTSFSFTHRFTNSLHMPVPQTKQNNWWRQPSVRTHTHTEAQHK